MIQFLRKGDTIAECSENDEETPADPFMKRAIKGNFKSLLFGSHMTDKLGEHYE